MHAVQIPTVILKMEDWIRDREKAHFIAVTGMHGISVAQDEEGFKQILNTADMVVPDGMPLVLLGRRRGYHLPRRVYGPELMEVFCQQTGPRYGHFFYGGAPGVAEALAEKLKTRFGTRILGNYCPPFRKLTPEENARVDDLINELQPDIVWVGLSTPKQECWMYEHRHKIQAPVLIGVGAAFDFISGRKKSTPQWIGDHGFEWLFRLISEPRRLWRRYLIGGSCFMFRLVLERLHIKSYD